MFVRECPPSNYLGKNLKNVIATASRPLDRELSAIVDAAWDVYTNSRKSPLTQKAGPGFADPDYETSVDWLAAREAILAAQCRHDDH
jgi:hypothetical protein